MALFRMQHVYRYEWRSARMRAKKVGFNNIEEYIENLISLDIQNNAIEFVLNKELKNYGKSNYPISRVADNTGLDKGFVISKINDDKL